MSPYTKELESRGIKVKKVKIKANGYRKSLLMHK